MMSSRREFSGFFHPVKLSDGKRSPLLLETAFEHRLGGSSSDWYSSIEEGPNDRHNMNGIIMDL